MDFMSVLQAVEAGGSVATCVVAYFLWRLDRRVVVIETRCQLRICSEENQNLGIGAGG